MLCGKRLLGNIWDIMRNLLNMQHVCIIKVRLIINFASTTIYTLAEDGCFNDLTKQFVCRNASKTVEVAHFCILGSMGYCFLEEKWHKIWHEPAKAVVADLNRRRTFLANFKNENKRTLFSAIRKYTARPLEGNKSKNYN